MAKKPASGHSSQRSVSSTPKASTPAPTISTVASSAPSPRPTPLSSSLSSHSSVQEIALHVWNKYLNETPSRTLLLDAFMAFLVVVGVIQFVYCVLAGNYPFNAFLSGFSAAVGQFVLTASLRMQTSERSPSAAAAAAATTTTTMTTKKVPAKTVDAVAGESIEEEGSSKYNSERAFADFVFGSLILHGFCVNFIN